MKVVVLINSLYTGGAEFSTLSFYQWFHAQGHEVMVVCVKKAAPSYDPTRFGFDKVHYLAGSSFLIKLHSFNQLVKSFRPDIVHSVLFEANMIGRITRRWRRSFIHLESLVNEMYSSQRLQDPNVTSFKLNGYRLLDKFTQGLGVDHFHATSNSVSQHYQQLLGIKQPRITVAPRGRSHNPYAGDQEFRHIFRTTFGIRDQDKVIIMVARQEFQKGYDILLKALARVSLQKDWVCLCVGREGNMSHTLLALATQLRLDKRIQWLGHRTDVMQLMALSDVFVFPSRFEGLPGALIEAEAAGLPIVCSDISNNKEVVIENENALLFPVNDDFGMSEKLARLLADNQLRQKMGLASKRIFEERFVWEKSHQRMYQLLQSLPHK